MLKIKKDSTLKLVLDLMSRFDDIEVQRILEPKKEESNFFDSFGTIDQWNVEPTELRKQAWKRK